MPATRGASIRVRAAGFKRSLRKGAVVAQKKKTARVVKKSQHEEAYQRIFLELTEELS